jgi:hypothetical protein
VQVCAYALRQHSLEQELQGGVLVSPFMRALQLADGTLCVMDKGGVYNLRCVQQQRALACRQPASGAAAVRRADVPPLPPAPSPPCACARRAHDLVRLRGAPELDRQRGRLPD